MRQKSSPPFKENGANVIHRLDDDPSESHITARFSLRILPSSLVKLGASFLVSLSFSASRFSKGVRNRVEVEASEISSYRFPSIKKKSFFRLEPKMNEQVLKEFYIPKYILIPNSKVEELARAPSSPVVVFINSKSGGQLGGDLLQTYRQLLSEAQVIDLGQEAPDKVLYRLYANLERLKSNGDILAFEIENKLRLIVAGGDGTTSWLLGVVSDLKLTRAPPIATVPLGTGNNLPFSFGWGKKNPGTDRHSVEHFLDQVMKAREMKIDRPRCCKNESGCLIHMSKSFLISSFCSISAGI